MLYTWQQESGQLEIFAMISKRDQIHETEKSKCGRQMASQGDSLRKKREEKARKMVKKKL
jgi:hypothetical protein